MTTDGTKNWRNGVIPHDRREFLKGAAGLAVMLAWPLAARSASGSLSGNASGVTVKTAYDLTIAETEVNFTGTAAKAITINGTIPGPLLRFREGDNVTINVTNRLKEATSIHWHGLMVPNAMDGVPGLTFPGIGSGETFTYKFKLRQSGTYWYHSHAILQEPAGFYAPIVVDPREPEPFAYDRDYVVLLSDWSDEAPARVLANLKKVDGYYNYRRQTLVDLIHELRGTDSDTARSAVIDERAGWARMRMDPTDYSDGGEDWLYLMQGRTAAQNWTALFSPGERVRLRFINGAAMNFFDISIPGLEMTVVQADGQNVRPVQVRELRIGNGETYDVIVQPAEDRAYTILAATIAGIGYARGTLAPRAGMSAPIPDLGPRPVRKLSGMGGAHGGMAMAAEPSGAVSTSHDMAGMSMPMPKQESMAGMDMPAPKAEPMPGMDHETPGGMAAVPVSAGAVLDKLSYHDLRALERNPDTRAPTKVIEMRLTGDMNRYFWSINDKKLSEAEPFAVRVGERVRFRLSNETMMEHPMHLHGTFFELDNGNGDHAPRKHTVIVQPGETLNLDTAFDEAGMWVFHCHLFYHAATGMIRVVSVS